MWPQTLLFLLLSFTSSAYSVTFENVTVVLTTQLLPEPSPASWIYINASDTLANYIPLVPLEVLSIRDENIPKLRRHSVSNLPNIAFISIVASGIQDVEPGAFENLPKLTGLNLENNRIQEVKNGVFTGLFIKSLFLDNNKISFIESSAFNNMSLQLISLNNNKISKWDSNWFMGTPLESIYMSNNFLEELPADAFKYGRQYKRINVLLMLSSLILSENRIRTIHAGAFDPINTIGYLNLSTNELDQLPDGVFRTVKSVYSLDLRNNYFRSVKGFFNDINIHQLVLLNNSLDCFPREVFDVSMIDNVFLDGNKMSCACVEMWKKIQFEQNIQVLFSMKLLEDDCIDLTPEDSLKFPDKSNYNEI